MKGEGWDEGWGAVTGGKMGCCCPSASAPTTGDCQMDSTPLGMGRAKRLKPPQFVFLAKADWFGTGSVRE